MLRCPTQQSYTTAKDSARIRRIIWNVEYASLFEYLAVTIVQ